MNKHRLYNSNRVIMSIIDYRKSKCTCTYIFLLLARIHIKRLIIPYHSNYTLDSLHNLLLCSSPSISKPQLMESSSNKQLLTLKYTYVGNMRVCACLP